MLSVPNKITEFTFNGVNKKYIDFSRKAFFEVINLNTYNSLQRNLCKDQCKNLCKYLVKCCYFEVGNLTVL